MAEIGEVEIKLDGKVEVLRSSLSAAKRVNAGGGFAHVINRIQAADLEFYTLVVAAGLNKKTTDVEEAVYRTGLPALGVDIVKFVNYLANGGKPFVAPDENAGGDAAGEG
jgi:hypothetical protein